MNSIKEMSVSEQFDKEVNEIVKNINKQISQHVNNNNVDNSDYYITDINVVVKSNEAIELINRYNLPNIKIYLEYRDYTVHIKFLYKYIIIKPQGHYILPDNYTQPTMLAILMECEKQKTPTPDISKLEIDDTINTNNEEK